MCAIKLQNYNRIIVYILIAMTGLIGGGYFLFASALLDIVLLGLILYQLFHEKKIQMAVDRNLLAFFVMVSAHLFSGLWAVDSGMAPLGFVKFLPVLLFYIYVSGEKEERECLIQMLPAYGAIMTLISLPMMYISAVKEFVCVNERLAGFFQYPNTYAMFMLVCLIISGYGMKEYKTEKKYLLYALVALVGIYMSGSRTVFVLTVFAVLWLLLRNSNSYKQILIGIGGILIVATIVFLVNGEMLNRFTSISLESSTFLGRLLYAKDALHLIISHPFGLGYYGYYFIQQSVQTGVYSVVHVHNDILQMFLDIGIIPSVLICAIVLKSVFSKQNHERNRVVLIFMILHSLFDYDFQFILMCFVFILFLHMEHVKTCKAATMTRTVVGLVGVCTIVFATMAGVSDCYQLSGDWKKALKCYEGNTISEMEKLKHADNAESMESIAEHLLSRNKHLSIAYSAKARAAFSKGDMRGFIENKNMVFECAPYQYEEYSDYLQGLLYAQMKCLESGNLENAMICLQKAEEVPELLKAVEKKTSAIAWKIKDKPQVELLEMDLELLMRMREIQ